MALSKEKRKYFNENFFEVIDSEIKAYLLGFIFADGCIQYRENKNEYILRLSVTEKDEEILILFQKHICPLNNIRNIKSTKTGIYTCKPKKSISFYSKKLFADLSNLGCHPKKTYLENKIPNIKEELKIHFIRGYFDGDGCICLTDKTNEFNIISNTKSIILDINEIFIKNNLFLNIYYEKSRKIYYIRTRSIKNIKPIYNLLYNNANFYLKRKKINLKKNKIILR